MNEKLLSLNNISISYGDLKAVEGVYLDIFQKDFIALIGPNGSGKTSLIRGLLHLIPLSFGSISYSETLNIGYLPQNLKSIQAQFPAYVCEVVKTGLLETHKKMFSRYEIDEKVDHILELLGIKELKHRTVSKLSGGQQQRVLLARALVSNPDLLILDEPTSALDPKMRTSFFDLIKQLNQKGMTILMVTHDVSYAYEYVNRIIALDQKVLFDGSCEAFCKDTSLSPFLHHHHHKEEDHA